MFKKIKNLILIIILMSIPVLGSIVAEILASVITMQTIVNAVCVMLVVSVIYLVKAGE